MSGSSRDPGNAPERERDQVHGVRKVATPPDLFPSPDSDVWLELDPGRIRWMDRDSGHAVTPVDGTAVQPEVADPAR